MAAATETIVDMICDKCKSNYQITLDKFRRRTRNGTPNLCKVCMKERQLEIQKNYYSSLSDDEKKKYIEKRNYYTKLSEEDKIKHAQRTKDQIANRTKEEQDEINKKNSEGLKKHWKTVSDKDKEKRIQGMRDGNKEYWKSLSEEEKHNNAIKWMTSRSKEELEKLLNRYSVKMTEYNQSLSLEEKQRRAKNMERWRDNLSEEQKKELYERTHQWYHDLSDEEKINYANSKREWYSNLSDDQRVEFIEKSDWYNKLSDEGKREYSQKQKEYWNNLSDEIRISISRRHVDIWNNFSDEKKQQISQRQKQYWTNLSDEEKIRISEEAKNRWNNMPIDKQASHTKKALSASRNVNKLNKRFEETFNSSHLVNDYYFTSEVVLYDTTVHSWDYGIYDKDNNLVMVVDLDGSYFHADNCDYDGLHSKEEYDEKRFLSIPSIGGIKHLIIQENNFSKCFELMVKTLMMNYDEYVENIFKIFRSMPFPSPRYTDVELIKAFHKLQSMKTDDKYHKDISLNTRIGDRLIQHFHPSIYQAKRKGCISPYEAWYDDELLKECIKNRIIYQTHLNPNKILQGFNVSKVAPKVSVFSAGRAKMLINRYLNNCNEIFDPFSGFSGRMLGTISLGKRYIGQDISKIHVGESNQMTEFLCKYHQIDVYITQQNIFDSCGEYECLFTCPPYEDIEQWLDVDVDKRTCDDWIDICLSHFNCKRYLFVVDYTEKYIKNVVDEIVNRSHFGGNSEYVVMIDR